MEKIQIGKSDDVVRLEGGFTFHLSHKQETETSRWEKERKHNTITNQQQSRKQTDPLAVDQLEDFGGPDDEYDRSCGNKVNTGLLLMSVNNMQMMGNSTGEVRLKLSFEAKST